VAFGVPVVSSPTAMSESAVGMVQKSIPWKPADLGPPSFPPVPPGALPPVGLPDVAAEDGAEEEPPPHAAAPASTTTVAAPAAIRRIRMGTNLAQRCGA
jgi:hypothetical protein